MADIEWVTEVKALKGLSPSLAQWLTLPQILSQSLQVHCHKLSLKLLSQGLQAAYPDEARILEQPLDKLPWVREVVLIGDDKRLTYGRVVVATRTYLAHFEDFNQLGVKLLGESLLYNKSHVTREAFEYALIPSDHAWFRKGVAARRSVFKITGDPLIVTDFFPADLPDYPA